MLGDEYGLTIVVVGAKNIKNVSTFGKMDPFVQIKYGDDTYKTCVIKDSSSSPGMRINYFVFCFYFGHGIVWNYEICLIGKTTEISFDLYSLCF